MHIMEFDPTAENVAGRDLRVIEASPRESGTSDAGYHP
jgi:hypothetical protein